MAKTPTIMHGKGYAWKVSNGRGGWTVCNWAEPSSGTTFQNSRPSPEATQVQVIIMPRTEFAAIVKREKALAARERKCAAIEYEALQATKSSVGKMEKQP